MSRGKALLGALALLAVLALPASAQANSPAWAIQSVANPTNFAAGNETGFDRYFVYLTNSGGASTQREGEAEDPIRVSDTLPAGLSVQKVQLFTPRQRTNIAGAACPGALPGATTINCEVTEALSPSREPAKLDPGNELILEIQVKVPPSATGTLVNRVEVEGGHAAPASWEGENQIGAEDAATAGFEEFRAQLLDGNGLPATAADSHPYSYVTSFAVNTVPGEVGGEQFFPAQGDLKNIEVALPPGLAANPTAIERCTPQQFTSVHVRQSKLNENFLGTNECPYGSAVGLAAVQQLEGENAPHLAPIYNLQPPKGMPAQLGFLIEGLPVYIDSRVRSDSDYGTTGYLHSVTEAQRVNAARITLWGTPWEESHDTLRAQCAELLGSCPVEGEARAFWRLPSSCENPLLTSFSFTTWAVPVTGASEVGGEGPPVGCAAAPFEPEIEAVPTSTAADSPTGLHFGLFMPQEEGEKPEALGEADLRETTVALPKGLSVNPASADGLAACTPAQVGLTTPTGQLPAHFNLNPANCPNASKLGTVEADVPALDHTIQGAAFLASQEDNPFNSLLAFYIVLEDEQSGVIVKLPAKVSADPVTGQLTTTVPEAPQVPVEEFRFDFFNGARAPLRTPMSCGTYATKAELTPWTAPQGASVSEQSEFKITAGPQGPCPSGALEPKLTAGYASTQAGSYSPFSLRLTREDGTQEFAGLTTTPPLGFTARLAGVPYCPDSAIAQAKGREHPGGGQQEISSPSCPSASQVGTITAGAGAGPSPFFVGGRLYLAGPYKGAPISLVAVIPAVAGPFDLGTVVNRVASYVDPETAQIKAVADPLPTILSGIPVDTRDLRVDVDRPNFALAPTSCEPKSVGATVTGTAGASATVSDRLQVGGCNSLKFAPTVSLTLKGGTKRAKHPALKAVVTYPQGTNYANTAKASVALPHSEFLEQSHIRTICTRVQFAANACPAGAIYGKAKAYTPLLDKPLEGPIYLRSSSNPLPDMVLDLHGQIDVVSAARIDSHNGGIRSSFESIPDAPLSKVIVELQGGKKGLLVNSRNICNYTNKATAKFTGQNGKLSESRPVLKDSCKKGKGGKKHKKGKGKKKR